MSVLEPDPYAEYRRLALAAGVDKDELEDVIAKMKVEAAALDRGDCPTCGKKIGRRVDPRQVGVSELAGTWVNYRCACGFMCDRKEAVPGVSS